MKKSQKLYAVYTDDVKEKEKYQVPNFCEITKYKSKARALKVAGKFGDKVYELDPKKVKEKCKRSR